MPEAAAKKDIDCHSCGQKGFEDYHELARHILSQQHSKGKKWANNYLLRHAMFEKAAPEHTPLTDEDRQAKLDCHRLLSGDRQGVTTVCPHCQSLGLEYLDVEYTNSPFAWKKDGRFEVLCSRCK